MSGKLLLTLLLVAILAGAAWYYRDNPDLRRWLGQQQAATDTQVKGATPDAAAAGLRKCRGGGKVVYTDGDCPKGSAEQPIKGSVTVVPSQPGSAAKPAPGAPDPAATRAHDLLLPDDAKARQGANDKVLNK